MNKNKVREQQLLAENYKRKLPQEIQIYWSSSASDNHFVLPLLETIILLIE